MLLIAAAAAVMTTSAHMSVEGFLGFRAGDGPWIEESRKIEVPVGTEGAALRFEATMGDDLMVRWVVVEPGHSYRVSQSACAGIAFHDLAKPKRRPFVQVDAHELPNTGFPLKVLALDGSELDSITFPDIGSVEEAQLDSRCPDQGARVRVVDATGKPLLDEWIVIPNERVTRVTLSPGGGFTATAFDASMIYLREQANRVDAVELKGLRIAGKPYQVRHEHGGEGAKASLAIFEVKNAGTTPRTLSAKSAQMIRDFGTRDLQVLGVAFAEDESKYSEGGEPEVLGVAFAEDESKYSEGGEPAPSVTIAPGETKIVRVHVNDYDAYLSSILSSFRWSVVFECDGKTATATVPLHVMRMEPYRPR
jgi:hypothetical protein